jgi:uncharacterized protein (TIGR03437 family)
MLLAAALALSIPLHFEPNQGQAPAAIHFIAANPTYTLFLSDTSIAMKLPRATLAMKFPRARVEALDPLPGRTNYYLGADRRSWRTNVPNYARAYYRSVFPGVDLAIYGKTQQVEYDWQIAPGANPRAIHFSIAGASHIRIDPSGDLVLDTPAGEVRHRKPYIYQEVGGRVRQVDGGFALSRGEVRFRVGEYDPRLPLVIDPQLIFWTGFGGTGIGVDLPQAHFVFSDVGTNIAVDQTGKIYVTGTAFAPDFPQVNSTAAGPAQPCSFNCVYSALFAAKISADGKTLLYSTYIAAPLGQTPSESPYQSQPPLPSGMALNAATGAVFITGSTSGVNFPLSGQATTAGGMDAFIVELDTNGALVASKLIGGSGDDAGTSIALGGDGNLYLAGTTQSSDFPTTAGAYQTAPVSALPNIFLAKLSPATLAIAYSTYLGPATSPAVSADSSGNAYIAASTTYPSWSTTPGAAQPQCAGSTCADAILLKVNPAGSQFVYATYFGGSGTETLGGLAVDATGSAYIAGSTGSSDLPTTAGAFQTTWTPANPGDTRPAIDFVAKFNPAGKLAYATYLDGSAYDIGPAIAVDSAGNAYIGGQTTSPEFPLAGAIQESLYNYLGDLYSASSQAPDGEAYFASAGFLTALNAGGSGLLWSTYLGSGAVCGIALDSAGNVYATGTAITLTAAPLAPSKSAFVGVVEFGPGNSPGLQFTANSIGNAASYHPGLPQAGGLATLFVTGLKVSGLATGSGNPLPTELAGVSIIVQGVPAPMLAVADIPEAGMQQINFQVPFEAGQSVNLVEVRYQGASTFVIPQTVGPGIFVLNDGTPAIQHAADYSLVTDSNPAHAGETIVVYVTGLGPVQSAVADGTPATSADVASDSIYSDNWVSFGTILYAGLTPGAVGLYQVNVQLPSNLSRGELSFSLTWGAGFGPPYPGDNIAKSNTVTLPVQ